MEKLQFKTEINATAQKVYEVMLGLKDKKIMNIGQQYLIQLLPTKEAGKREAKYILWVWTKTAKKAEWFLKL